MTTKRLSLLGQTFGRLTVTKDLGRHPQGRSYWECVCSCPKQTVMRVKGYWLTSGNTQSCGCLRAENSTAARFVHGMTSSSAYGTWRSMMERCYAPDYSNYENYGGRGIQVCDRWHDPRSFLEDMGEPPSDAHTLDRIDVNGHYEPQNCRWATPKQQARNRRNNRLLTWRGKTQCVAAWAEELGIPYEALRMRLARPTSTIEKALSRPYTPCKPRTQS